jgi:choline dehydrogenase
MNRDACDYVVIGAGAAGCAVAGRLSENPDHRVVLLEAGAPDRNICFKVPGLGFLVTATQKYDWNLLTEPVPGLNNRQLQLFQGKVLGGSSSINGMQYSRGHSSEYDKWHRMGCTGWAFDDVLPYFKRAEANARGASRWHGASGPLRIRQAKPELPICEAFLNAAAEAGYPVVDDLNCDLVEGFGYSDVNIYKGRRISSAVAYLGSAGARKNLTVLTRSQALRIIVDRGKATGVEIAQDGMRRILRCEGEVIVCAGGIQSPHLLMLSGIGPADHLGSFGIPVVVDSPNVGQNFQNHACYRVQYACSEGATAYRHVKPLNALKAAFDYVFFRTGALAESYVAAGGFIRTDPGLAISDVQITMSAALVTLPNDRKPNAWDLLPKQDGFSMTINQGAPFSRGEVRLRSADPVDAPRVHANYFSDPRDMAVLIKALQLVRRIMSTHAIRPLVRAELRPGEAHQDAASLEAEIRRNAGNSYHPAGTCAMGGDARSVVDPKLHVRGVDGLRVADNSIMPLLPNAGLHAPAIMIGEKAAAMIAAGGA